MKGDDIADRLLDLGCRVLRLVDAMPRRISGRHVAAQLMKCGTSAGANYEEARGAESHGDFVHKLGVAWKEARETCYWLKLIHRSQLVKPLRVEKLLLEADELSRILAKSRITAQKNEPK